MYKVDNSGQGNCLYYAYGLSLMYWLRSRQNRASAEMVFAKLHLNEKQKTQLHLLLKQPMKDPFSHHDIKSCIEPILGPATRSLAAESTRQKFMAKPDDNALFAAAQYGLVGFILKTKNKTPKALNDIKIAFDYANENYTQSDLFLVPDILIKMEHFTKRISPKIMTDFVKEWAKQEKSEKQKFENLKNEVLNLHNASLDEQKKKGYHGKNKIVQAGIDQYLTTSKTNLLFELMRKPTITFFSENNYQVLDQYIDYIKTDCVWGSEEIVLTLNAAIQGERFERNTQGLLDHVSDLNINLIIYRNGEPTAHPAQRPDIILNNHANIHWTSIIPEHLFKSPQRHDHEPHAQPTQRIMKSPQFLTQAEPNTRSHHSPNTMKQMNQEMIQAKQNFDNQLQLLFLKTIGFARNKVNAYKIGDKEKEKQFEAAKLASEDLFNALASAALSYFKNPSEESYRSFKKCCDQQIEKARPELEKHRGMKQLLGNLALAVIGLGILYLIAISINKLTTGHFLFFKTETATIMDSLEECVCQSQPLKSM